jgi:hypothetical protein
VTAGTPFKIDAIRLIEFGFAQRRTARLDARLFDRFFAEDVEAGLVLPAWCRAVLL